MFEEVNGRLILKDIVASLPAARVPVWRTRIRGAWLRKIGDTQVKLSNEVETTFKRIHQGGSDKGMLTFSHPEVSHGLTYEGIPHVNLDMMNPRRMMDIKFCSVTMGNPHNCAPSDGKFVPDRPHNGLITTKKSGVSSTTSREL